MDTLENTVGPLPAWVRRASCRQADPEIFFPEKGQRTADAKRICDGCPVRRECLQYALDNRESIGVWGGVGERERRRMLRHPHTTQKAA